MQRLVCFVFEFDINYSTTDLLIACGNEYMHLYLILYSKGLSSKLYSLMKFFNFISLDNDSHQINLYLEGLLSFLLKIFDYLLS